MMVVVKFKGSPTPTFMQVENVSHIWDLSTMDRVEWVSSGYFASDGTYHVRKGMTHESGVLGDVIVDPYKHGDPSPYERFKTNVGGDLVPNAPVADKGIL